MDVAAYCLELPGAEETYPFGVEYTVMKVGGKVFAIMPAVDSPDSISLKCDPARSELLREKYAEITPGYHLNKTHWNSLDLRGMLPHVLVKELIEHSYELVAKRKAK